MELQETLMHMTLNVKVVTCEPHQLQEVKEKLRQERYQHHLEQLRNAQKKKGESEDSVDLRAFSESSPFWRWGGRDLLHLAAEKGRLDVVQKLVEMGTSVDIKDDDGWTPLMYASWLGHYHVVVYLVLNKASIHELDKNGFSAALRASEHGHVDIVDYLTCKDKRKKISDK